MVGEGDFQRCGRKLVLNPSGISSRYLSRRGVVKGAAVGGLMAAVAVGCGREAKPAPAPGSAQPKRGGTLRWHALLVRPPYDRGLDPHIQISADSGRMRLFYQTLVRANPRTWQVEPELAQRWEQPSPTELVFTLAPGVKFHDKPPANGRDLRPADVVFSLERARTNDPRFAVRSLLDSVDKIEAVDASRVKLTLKLVDVGQVERLTAFSLAVLAPEVVERAAGRFATPDVVVGTGPFILTELNDTVAVHVRNPNYWKPGLPHLDQVVMPGFADEQAKWAALQAGGIELIDEVPGTVAGKYAERQGQLIVEGKFPAEWAAPPTMLKFFINVKRRPLDDTRVYRALRLLIDYDEVLRVDSAVSSGWGRVSQAFPAALAAWDFSQQEYLTRLLPWKQPKDEAVKMAVDLLSAAGFNKDRPLTLALSTQSSPSYQRRAELLQAQWRRLGQGAVESTIRLIEEALRGQVLARRDFEAMIIGAAPPVGEPDTALRVFYHSTGSRNYAGWEDPQADALIDRQRATVDLEQRKAVIKDTLRYLIENAPMATWTSSFSLTATQPRVQGWAPQADAWASGFQFEDVWLER